MKRYDIEFDIETEKLNELENLCKEFHLNPIETPKSMIIYQNSDILVQETFTKDKVKILITGEEKIYASFMEKFSQIYNICDN